MDSYRGIVSSLSTGLTDVLAFADLFGFVVHVFGFECAEGLVTCTCFLVEETIAKLAFEHAAFGEFLLFLLEFKLLLCLFTTVHLLHCQSEGQ